MLHSYKITVSRLTDELEGATLCLLQVGLLGVEEEYLVNKSVQLNLTGINQYIS